jgi:hypothetical protein
MNAERDVSRIVRSWLEEGVTALPERVLDAVLDQVPATPQRRSWWPTRRFARMNNPLRIAIAAAGVLAIAIIGIQFLPPNSGVGGPAASSTPGASPTAAATAAATPLVRQLPSSGTIRSGRYSVDVPGSDINALFTVNIDWEANGWYISGGSRAVSFWTVSNVNSDGCDISTAPNPPIGGNVDDLVTALDAQDHTDMTPAVDDTVGGFPARRVELRPAAGASAVCDQVTWWLEGSGNPGRGANSNETGADVVWIVDVHGQRIVIVAVWNPAEPLDATAVADVIASMTFTGP